MKKKIFLTVILLFVAVRVAAPPIILQKLNKFLASFSPIYFLHIEDLDLAIVRGAYRFEGIQASLKKENEVFFSADKVEVSLAWRELFRGRIVTDVVGDGLDLIFTPELKAAMKNAPKKEAGTVKEKLILFDIERIDLRNSEFQYADLPALPEVQRWKITGINGRISNVLPQKKNPISLMTAKGLVLGSSTVKAVGYVDMLSEPARWDVDVELREFDLVKANPLLKRKLPLTFTAGTLDAYIEVKSEKDRIEGSVKPFFKKVDVVATAESFLGLKHFGIEVGTAAINLILRNSKEKTLATKILFAYEQGKFELNSRKALTDAIAHGFEEKMNPGIEDDYQLSTAELSDARKTVE